MARAKDGTRGREEQKALQAFVTDFLLLAGAEYRKRGDELHVSFPAHLEALFGKTNLRLAFRAHDLMDPEVHLVQPGSVLLEKMVAHLRERVGVALAEAPAVVPAEAVLPPEVEFRCEARLGRVDVDPEEYVTFNFRVSFICDQKNEEIWSVTVDSEGRPVEDADLLARLAEAPARDGEMETSRRTLGALYSAAEERARVYAEQSATRYEQETLPRLYRELTRLRAFYQAQISELDSRVTEDDRMRDHLERELRLRTAEEIDHHRMTVSLALVNFRVVRIPRARYSLRLSSAHSRRSHTLERDLTTGVLLVPQCEACGRPLAAADLCAGAHLLCPECVHTCSHCGKAQCKACGLQSCARCEGEVCAECRTVCAACENVICPTHTASCPVCGRAVCDTCLQECAVCGGAQCVSHLAPCAKCGRPACANCSEACAACGESFCLEHTAQCERCGQVFCVEHLAECAVCGTRRCNAHLDACVTCGRRLCDEDRHECGGCGATVCAVDRDACPVCEKGVCAACGSECAATGRLLCPEHAATCEICGRAVTPDVAAVCERCGRKTCPDHADECHSCGKVLCADHLLRCRLCESPVCEECGGDEAVCCTCMDPEAGEEIAPTEVLDLAGLPAEWRRRVGRGHWRRVRRGDRVVYYGRHLFRLMVVSVDGEGRCLGAKEASVLGSRGW